MKKEILFASIVVLLYSGCSQKGTILGFKLPFAISIIWKGRVIEGTKKVLISKDQLSKTISQNKSSSTPKK